jgi:hypothetical protein
MMNRTRQSIMLGLLLAGPLAAAIASQAPATRREVPMDPERARRLYVSNKPEDLPTCNCARDSANQKTIDDTYLARTQGVMDYEKSAISARSTASKSRRTCSRRSRSAARAAMRGWCGSTAACTARGAPTCSRSCAKRCSAAT